MRSQRIGLRLCGMAELPFWPRPKGSSTSLHLGALQVSDLDRHPLERRRRGARALAGTRHGGRAGRPGSRPAPSASPSARQTCALDRRIEVGEGADRSRELARPGLRRSRPRAVSAPAPSSDHAAKSLSPKVIGSAWMPWVRPTMGTCRNSSARLRSTSRSRSTPARINVPLSRSWTARVVSRTSELVSPQWIWRAAGPIDSASTSTKAATSCCVTSSRAATRSASTVARSRTARESAVGISPRAARASHARISISCHSCRRRSSLQIAAISGRL